MDDLDRLMDQPADAPAASDPIDSAMDGYMQEQTGALRAGATLAIDSNPDEIARQKRIAKVLDVPVAAVEADPAFATRQQKLVEVEKATAQAPALRQKFTDADFAKLAHDDLDNLSGFEQLIRSAKRGWAAGLRGWDAGEIDAAARGLNALDQRNPANEPLRPGRNFTAADPATLGRIRGQYSTLLGENAADFARRTAQLEANAATGATRRFYETQGWGEAVKALASDPFEISGNVVLESLGIMAPGTPAIVAGGLTGGPAGAGAAVGATSYSAEYGSAIAEEMQKSGVDLTDVEAVKAFVATPEFAEVRRKASIKAAVIGAFDAATAGVAGVRLRPSATGNIAAQTGVQAAGGAAGEAAGSAASGQEINAASVLAEAIGEVPGALVDVTTQSGRNVIISRAKAEQAEADAKIVENLNQLATSSKVLQRDADTFEQFVAAAAEDGPADTVYVDGRMLMQSGMAPRLAELSPAVRDQLDRAIITGGDIAIPVAEYAARIAPTDIAPQLIDHLKFDPEGFTRAEAADFMANEGDALQAEVERMLTDRQDADTFRASQDVVKQDILSQLNTAGRFTPQVNEAYATLASSYSAVRAAQLGMTPEAFHQQRGMRVQGAAVAGRQFSQGAQPPDREFSLSDLPRDMREELFNEHAMNLNPDATERAFLRKRVPSGLIDIKDVQVDEIPADQLQRYVDAKLADLPPIVIADGRLIDGQHRIQAARARGIRQLRYIDMTGLIDTEAGGYVSELPKSADTFNQSGQLATDTPAFKAWFGDSKVVDADGKPLVVYHNTDSDFDVFDFGKLGAKTGASSAKNMGMFFSSERVAASFGDRKIAAYIKIENPLEISATDFQEYLFGERERLETIDQLLESISDDIGTKVEYHDEPVVYDDGEIKPLLDVYDLYDETTKANYERLVEIMNEDPRDSSDLWGYKDEEWAALKASAIEKGHDGIRVAAEDFSPGPYNIEKAEELFDDNWIAFEPTQIKSAVGNRGTFDPNDPNILNQSASQDGAVTLRALADEGNNQAIVAQALVDRAGFGPEQFANILEGAALGAQPDGLVSVPAFASMLSHMRAAVLDDLKVLDAIVGSVPVDMVNNLAGSESAAKVLLHDEAMNEDSPAFNADLMVANGVDTPDPVGLLVREAALAAAKVASVTLNNGRESSEAGAAIIAGDGNSFSQSARLPRAAFHPSTNTITLLDNADLTSFLHESAHYFFESDIQLASELVGKESLTHGEQQIVDDVGRLLTWHGIQGDVTEQLRQWHTMDFEEQRSHHERTAESFEAYLFSGQAPSLELQPIFQRFRAWLVNVYKSLKDFLDRNPEAGKLTDEVRQVFDRMIATSEQIALAEQGRSMLPLFGDPAKSGMTPDELAKYQAQGIDATNEAIQNLQAKGLRDLQWLANAKGRQVARLKREARALRAEAELEARREVMSQPVYRAWDFLTRKLGQEDKLPPLERKSDPDVLDPTLDSLFVAIAKLGGIRKDQVISEWGVDPKDIPQSGLFGKPVWRITDGLTLDGMAEALSQHGYLPLDENGKYELNDLADRFLEELGGNTQYSHAHQPQDLQPGEQIANPGGLTAGRLDLAGLAAIGVPVEVAARLAELKMTAKEGLHPDLVAEMFGFTSGDELTRALAAAEKPKAAITGLADRLMLERHGELATPEAIERAADAAIHNEARARFVATEYNALAKATGQRRVLASAAKDFAAQMIARLKIRDIRPQQYANAEVRAAKAAEKASAAGKMAEAAAEKRNQLVNTYATHAAYDAQDEVQSTLRAWSKLVNRSNKSAGKTFDLDILNAVRAILGEYGIAPKTGQRAAEYLKAVQQYDPEIYAVIQDSVQRAEANAKPVKDMTLEELRGLKDEIDAITHLAKRSHQMEVDGNLLDLEDIQGELLGRMTEYGIPDKIAGEGQAVTRSEERMTKFKSLLAFARRVESWVGQMDGKEQMGPFRRFIWSRVSDAAVAYRTDKARYLKQFRDLVKAIAPSLKPQIVAAPELGYTFGKDSGGSAINEILHAILHTGNESNKRKLLLGRGWAVEVAPGQIDTTRWDAFIARMVQEGKLTREHFDFVQGTWDLLESMKPLAQKTHRDVFGRYFDEVTADGFTDPFGVSRRGGYVPAMVDSRVVKDANLRALADEDNAAMAYAFPTTPKGFTKTRTEYNRPLLLDLRTLSQHIDKVLLFSHLEMPVRDVQRALSKQVGETLNRIDNTAIPGMLLPWLNRSARQQVETPIAGSAGTMRFFSVLRSRAGAAAMFGNLANTVQQLTGFSLAAVQVKPGLLLSATADFMKSPREFAKAVSESSPYMNTRMANEISAMTDAINDIMLNPSLLERAQAWTMRHAYFLQSAMDNTMSPIIWTAAYNQAVQNGSNHDDAVRLADGTVRQTQGAMQAEDISRIEGGNAFVRMFTQFAGYFNMNANLLGTEFARMMHDGGLRKNAGRGVFVFVLGYLVPAIVGEAIIQAFRGGPGDDDEDGEYLDDWLAALFGWAPLRYATAMVPVGGQAVNAMVNAWNGKPYDDRLATSPAISMLESAARAPVSAYKAIDGDASAQKAVRDVATLLSMTLGLPANIAARPVGYGAGVLDETIDPTSEVDFVRGLLTGQASAESKQ